MNALIKNNITHIKNLFIKYKVTSAFLFGSYASNNEKATSDVDFLFSFSSDLDYETYANNYFSLADDLEKLLQKKVDLVAEKTIKNPFLKESIDKTKIQLL
jgi:predicted nucleotidyltransferase